MNNYIGVAIGGEKDGRWMEHVAPLIRMPRIAGYEHTSTNDNVATVIQEDTYHHMTFFRGKDGVEIHGWVDSSLTFDEAILRVFENYRGGQ